MADAKRCSVCEEYYTPLGKFGIHNTELESMHSHKKILLDFSSTESWGTVSLPADLCPVCAAKALRAVATNVLGMAKGINPHLFKDVKADD